MAANYLPQVSSSHAFQFPPCSQEERGIFFVMGRLFDDLIKHPGV